MLTTTPEALTSAVAIVTGSPIIPILETFKFFNKTFISPPQVLTHQLVIFCGFFL